MFHLSFATDEKNQSTTLVSRLPLRLLTTTRVVRLPASARMGDCLGLYIFTLHILVHAESHRTPSERSPRL